MYVYILYSNIYHRCHTPNVSNIYIKYSIHGSYIYMGIQTHNQQNYFNPNLRWWSGSFYVYNAQDPLPNGVSKNTSHGVTISIKKRGGHLVAWDLARRCAKWA